jgi:predicted O-linked N-acetylglucosamine transferase (SPINDLY family)
VLFMDAKVEATAVNLRRQAQAKGIDPARLVFGTPLSLPDWLARHRVADLFLDTLPYNAGTTASDALWAGLPLLTRRGRTFAGRVAASLLEAAGLPELIVSTVDEYEATAIALARSPERLAEFRLRLAGAHTQSRLFDTGAHTRALEAAFEDVHTRQLAGLPPKHRSARAERP